MAAACTTAPAELSMLEVLQIRASPAWQHRLLAAQHGDPQAWACLDAILPCAYNLHRNQGARAAVHQSPCYTGHRASGVQTRCCSAQGYSLTHRLHFSWQLAYHRHVCGHGCQAGAYVMTLLVIMPSYHGTATLQWYVSPVGQVPVGQVPVGQVSVIPIAHQVAA